MPANVVEMFNVMIPIFMFDIAERLNFIPPLLPNEEQTEDKGLLSSQMSRLGYDSNNPIMNLGSLALTIAFLLANMVFTILILKPIGYFSAWVKYYIKKNFYKIMYANIITVFMEGYLEFIIATWMFFQKPEQSYMHSLEYNSMIAFMILINLLLVILQFRIMKKPVERLKMYKY